MSDTTDDPTRRVTEAVVDACAVAVGLGLMAVNRFQAVRRQVVADGGSDDGSDGPEA